MITQQTIEKFRQSSREIARDLGLLVVESPYDLSLSFRHALIEIDLRGSINQVDLTVLLQLNKSTISRIIKKLIKYKLVTITQSEEDQRYKFISLTASGKKTVSVIHNLSNDQVHSALKQLSRTDQNIVIQGITLYAEALKKLREQKKNKILVRK